VPVIFEKRRERRSEFAQEVCMHWVPGGGELDSRRSCVGAGVGVLAGTPPLVPFFLNQRSSFLLRVSLRHNMNTCLLQ
jgi:hypothetical protein